MHVCSIENDNIGCSTTKVYASERGKKHVKCDKIADA